MIIIKHEFRDLIPRLSQEEKKQLEDNILKDGIRDDLILWNDILLDGHNRYEIAEKHGLRYKTKQIELKDEKQAKEWIILNQFGRRNLNNYSRAELALELKGLFAVKAKENSMKSGGDRKSDNYKSGLENSPKSINPIDTRKEVSVIAEVSDNTIARVEKIKKHAEPEVIERLKSGEVSINQVYQQVRKEESKKKKAEQLFQTQKELKPTEKKYRVIYADPPWKYGEEQHVDMGNVQTTVLGSHYPSMSIQELSDLPVKNITTDNAVLFLWVTSPLLEECFPMIKAWGFKYKTSMVWDKIKHNVGNYVSVRHEFLLICTKGACTPDVRKLFDSVQSIERTEHSKKPEEFRTIIETIYTEGNKVELFRRGDAPEGWDTWGNEA